MEAPNPTHLLESPQAKRLFEILEEKFSRVETVFVIHIPAELKDLFIQIFGKNYLRRDEWEAFRNSVVTAPREKEGTPQNTSKNGKSGKERQSTNGDGKERQNYFAAVCRFCIPFAADCRLFGIKCKDINMIVLMDAIGNVLKRRLEEKGRNTADATRVPVKLAIMHLLTAKKCTHEELVSGITQLADEIAKRYGIKKRVRGLDEKSERTLKVIDGLLVYRDGGIQWYEIREGLLSDIEQEYFRLLSIEHQYEVIEKKIVHEKSSIGDPEEAIDRFADFIENFVVEEEDESGKKKPKHAYLEKLKDLLVLKKSKSLEVDWAHLNSYDTGLAHALLETTDVETLISYMERGVAKVLTSNPEFGLDPDRVPRIKVRIYNLPTTLIPREVKKEHILHFIQVEGIVNRVPEVKPSPVRAVFVCKDCGNEMVRLQKPYLPFVRPPKCDACGSRNLELDIAKSTFENVQFARLQDDPAMLSGKTIPRHIDVVFQGELADMVTAGDRVRVTGVLQVVQRNDKSTLFKKILVVNHVEKLSKTFEEVEYSEADIPKFREEVRKPYFKEKIIRSIAPGVFGREKVKFGILLALLGGEERRLPDGTTIRGRIHVLMLGDPGTAKSTILDFVKNLAPRAVRSSGRGASAAGITAAAVRDETTGEWVLEAGTMVLADNGFALIDELDKMREHDRSNIHQAMEQGIVSINKAGIVADLNARATVIAAANPKHGRWDRMKAPADQVGFNPTLLSRFDLIFLILDEPDEEFDRQLIEHMKRRQNPRELMADVYDVEFLRKFIAYVRKNIHPVMTEEAWEYLKEYYVSLRKSAKRAGSGFDKIPITARQAEALERLATAHAKLFLREQVTAEDMRAAIELMEYSIRMLNPDREMDSAVVYFGRPTEEMYILEKLEEIVRLLDDGRGAPYDAIVSEARIQLRLSTNEIDYYLNQLLKERRIRPIGRIGGVEHYQVAVE